MNICTTSALSITNTQWCLRLRLCLNLYLDLHQCRRLASYVSSFFSFSSSLAVSVSVSFCSFSLHFAPCTLLITPCARTFTSASLFRMLSCSLISYSKVLCFSGSHVLLFSCLPVLLFSYSPRCPFVCLPDRLFYVSLSFSLSHLSSSVASCSDLGLPLHRHLPSHLTRLTTKHLTQIETQTSFLRLDSNQFSTSLSRECAISLRGSSPCQANSDNSSLFPDTSLRLGRRCDAAVPPSTTALRAFHACCCRHMACERRDESGMATSYRF